MENNKVTLLRNQLRVEREFLYEELRTVSHYRNDAEVYEAHLKAQKRAAKELGYFLSEEEKDLIDERRYMYSESMGLYCLDQGGGSYWVFNGHWEAFVDGDDTEICHYEKGHPENEHRNTTDWREVSGAFMARECAYFERPIPIDPEGFNEFDDDITF